MKRILIVFFLLFGLVSCKFAAKEVKKVSKIRKAVKATCDCRWVDVTSDYDLGEANLLITIDDYDGDSLAQMADSIIVNVKKVFPKLCNHDEVNIIFSTDDYDVEYKYYGCDLNPDVDTTYWDFDDYEEFEGFEEETEASTTDEDVKGIDEMIEELEALKKKMKSKEE